MYNMYESLLPKAGDHDKQLKYLISNWITKTCQSNLYKKKYFDSKIEIIS